MLSPCLLRSKGGGWGITAVMGTVVSCLCLVYGLDNGTSRFTSAESQNHSVHNQSIKAIEIALEKI